VSLPANTFLFLMPDVRVFEYPVPEGFPAMCLPTKPETRLPDNEIKIVYAEEKDMEEWVCIVILQVEASC
jgi:hypothetical protein